MKKALQTLLMIVALLVAIVAPSEARICNRVIASLVVLETGHSVDPCAHVLATVQTAVSTITSSMTAVGLLVTAVAALFATAFITRFATPIIANLFFSPSPLTPPPRLCQ